MPAPTTGESPSLPGYFQPQPEVLTPPAIAPVESCAMKVVVSRPISGSTAWRQSSMSGASAQFFLSRSGTSLSYQARHTRALSGMRLSSASAPISRAKRAAPVPTRKTCGSFSITARATAIGWRKPLSAPTEPMRSVVPSITEASSSTSPSRLGQPPRPTVRTVSSLSTRRMPASIAARPGLPSASSRAVVATPGVPSLLVTTIILSPPLVDCRLVDCWTRGLSDDMRRRQAAGKRGMADLELKGRVLDPEALVQLAARLCGQFIVDRRARADEMNRQRRFRRAHAPDMEIVDLGDARQAGEIGLYGVAIDALGHHVHRQIDGIAQQAPGADCDHGGDGEADRR